MQLALQVRGQDLQDRLVRQGFEPPVFNCRMKEQNNQLRLKKSSKKAAISATWL
jgi:hypothetical protein